MIITVATIIIAMVVIMVTVPKIYGAFIDAKLLFLEDELELLRELRLERNDCMLHHLGCGLAAMLLLWMVKSSPELTVPNQMTPALAIYAAGSLFYALLESLLVHKIEGWLVARPARMEVQDHP